MTTASEKNETIGQIEAFELLVREREKYVGLLWSVLTRAGAEQEEPLWSQVKRRRCFKPFFKGVKVKEEVVIYELVMLFFCF